MRYGIISDIHSNLEALNAVLKNLEKEKPDEIICLGDIVGYGANPNECVEIVSRVADKVVAGNHDYGALYMTDLDEFTDIAREACEWTAKQLNEKNKEYLANLPLTLKIDDMILTHSAPSDPPRWKYILKVKEAYYEFDTFKEKICLIGHTHVPVIFYKKNNDYGFEVNYKIELHNSVRYLINPGSVGQPRDFDPRASFAILDTDENLFKVIRVEYDIHTAQRKIIDAGLPLVLAYRLREGR